MTPEEAVKIIERERDSMRRLVDDCNLPITGGHKYIEAYDMAISALEKQIPKKPTLHEGWLYCSVCKKDILMEGYKFCPDCGQRIDWSDEG